MKKQLLTLLAACVLCACGNAQKQEEMTTRPTTTTANVPLLTLNNGVQVPQFGLGVYAIPEGEETYNAVLTALRKGYRHIDTAHAYQNERSVGKAVHDSGVPREEIWITSKLWPNEYGEEQTPEAIERMLKRLGVDYLDLVYLHQPVGDYVGAWHALEQALADGKVRAIGISDFDVNDSIFHSIIDSVHVMPQMFQIECHPYAQREHWQEVSKQYGIQIECWFPLGGRVSNGELLRDPLINSIAEKHGKSAAQIIIRWHIQKGFVVIPGASNPDYIAENIEVFDFALSDEEMEQMHALNAERRYFDMPYDEQVRMFGSWEIWD